MGRESTLQHFLMSAKQCFGKYVQSGDAAQTMVRRAFEALEAFYPATTQSGERLGVVDEWLDVATSIKPQDPLLQQMIDDFVAIEPRIRWQQRPNLDMSTSSANIAVSHANGMIFGPNGIEERSDVWLGLTLLAPHTRYPDHNHLPAEVYLNLSAGEFRQADGDWFSPGIGGSFYNVPSIVHAMRSTDAPLFAFWLLYGRI